MKQVILFNGPPRSGKDTAAKLLSKEYPNVQHVSMANELKEMTHRLYDIIYPNFSGEHVRFDFFESVKDISCDAFFGLTPRQAYINVAEKLVKPVHGIEFFAKVAYKNYIEHSNSITVISDLGFQQELDFFYDKLGEDNVFVVKLYRPNCDFSNDSRNYVNAKNFTAIENSGDIEEFNKHIINFGKRLIKKG